MSNLASELGCLGHAHDGGEKGDGTTSSQELHAKLEAQILDDEIGGHKDGRDVEGTEEAKKKFQNMKDPGTITQNPSRNLAPSDVYIYRKNALSPNGIQHRPCGVKITRGVTIFYCRRDILRPITS